MITQANIVQMLSELGNERPIFHSEADFQHSLAWKMHEHERALGINKIRLEKAVLAHGRTNSIDIVLMLNEGQVPIELKYKTKDMVTQHSQEDYVLKNHGARDVGGYLFIKDISRLEDFKAHQMGFLNGFAIFITNDSAYIRDSNRNVCYEDFKVTEARHIPKGIPLAWKGTLKDWQKSKPPITMKDDYTIHWSPYSPGFHYSVVEVK